MDEVKVLGIDLASGKWSDNGSAVLSFDNSMQTWTGLRVPAVAWPRGTPTPLEMARVIDEFAIAAGITAVALDGPQGWRNPATPIGLPGVGRRCEFLCRTQGKTGIEGKTYPQTQHGWIKFCVDVFDELLRLGRAKLANSSHVHLRLGMGYWLMECFPTWTWKESGLVALPGKAARPDTAPYWEALREAFKLPDSLDAIGHDDLQGVVAALVAGAAVGGPCVARSYGEPAFLIANEGRRSTRLEGLIWSATPNCDALKFKVVPNITARTGKLSRSASDELLCVRVTQKVLDQVNRQGPSAAQIAIKGATLKMITGLITLRVGGTDYRLIKGDTHAVWRSHQNPETLADFEELFGALADEPNKGFVASS